MQFSQQIPGNNGPHNLQNQTQIVFYPVSTHNTNPRMVNLLNDSYDSLTSVNQFYPCGQLDNSVQHMSHPMVHAQQASHRPINYMTAQVMHSGN